MYVAVDDTDSIHGNCTTFLATEIIRELDDLDLIGYPRLVRLNPAVPWKTRGNGSLVMRFGKGTGKKELIGSIEGKDIYCFEKTSSYGISEEEVISRLIPLVEKYHEDSADPGIIVSKVKPSQKFYWKGVRTILDRKTVDEEIRKIGAKTFEMGCGRGLIGSLCGMSWRPKDSTLELLAYRPMVRWGTERVFDPMSIRSADMKFPSTFNSWEERNQKVTMVPSTPCPVMYGFRGEIKDELLGGYETIQTEPLGRWIIFLTNQGTDDHIIYNTRELTSESSYYIEGRVTSPSRHEKGGHTFMDVETRFGTLTLGAYEPSKEFRQLFDNLMPGDRIGVMGELRKEPRTLNVEKLRIIGLSENFEKVSNPICDSCGKRMESVGKNKGYRCRKCHTVAEDPVRTKKIRWVTEGWYEPPESARRHLSKPLKRMKEEQPVMFVNSRI
jgi:Predicted DNA-binding protein containing a Zn-ribbon domain